MAESGVLDPADIGLVAAGLADGSVGVRAATFEALSRLPMTAPDWREVGRYALRVLAGDGSAPGRSACPSCCGHASRENFCTGSLREPIVRQVRAAM